MRKRKQSYTLASQASIAAARRSPARFYRGTCSFLAASDDAACAAVLSCCRLYRVAVLSCCRLVVLPSCRADIRRAATSPRSGLARRPAHPTCTTTCAS